MSDQGFASTRWKSFLRIGATFLQKPVIFMLFLCVQYHSHMRSRERAVSIILSRFFEKHQFLLNIFAYISHFIPHSVLRSAIQFESLSFHEQLILRGGYKDLFYRNLQVSKKDLVLVLGAFKGNSVTQWRSRFQCNVLAVEPMPDALGILQELFSNDNCVEINSCAVSNYNGNIE